MADEIKTYKIKMADGSEMELPGVKKTRSDGSGRFFDMEDGSTIKFDDGETKWAVPIDTKHTAPAQLPPVETPSTDDPAASEE